MDRQLSREALVTKLKSNHGKETASIRDLRKEAIKILEANQCTTPEDCLALVTKVVRPLFSTTKNAALTSTGRKNLVPPPPSAGRYSDNLDWDESKPWKNSWTVDLLIFVLSTYGELPVSPRKATLEGQFYLLIPPILNMIDDGEIKYKTQGCALLRLLCQIISSCQSHMLKRTGLTDVFVGALKANFMLLPTLTPEDESLALLEELYPAFRALIEARFPDASQSNIPADPTLTIAASRSPATSKPPSNTTDAVTKKSHLELLLRNGILPSYRHASESIPISTLLLTQLSPIIAAMGITAAKYLHQLLPLLRNVLSNPFGTASPELLLSALGVTKTLIEVCGSRIKQVWWAECLRGCVACWEETCEDEGVGAEERLRDVRRKLQEVVALLGHVVGEELSTAQSRIVEADPDVKGLFELVRDTKDVNPS